MVTPADTTIVVSWSTPGSTGGAAINGYVATASPGGQSCTAAASVTSCSISGLTNGATYRVSVVAANIVGTGPPSSQSLPVVPSGLPGIPPGLSATDRSTTGVRLAWATASGNGSAIDQYQVSAKDLSANCTVGATDGTCVVGGLPSGSCFQFSIRAHNANGWGASSGYVQGCTSAAQIVYHAHTVRDNLYQYPGPNFDQSGWSSGPRGTQLDIVCQVRSNVASSGNYWWHKLTNGHYIPDDYTDTPSIGPGNGIPQC